MFAKLLPALIGLIDRVKEGHRIGNVNDDGQSQLAGGFPNGIKAGVIHLHQFAGMIGHLQPQVLPHLQSFGASFFLNPQPSGRPFGKTIAFLGPAGPIHTPKDHEPLWGGLFEMIEMGIQQMPRPSRHPGRHSG